MSTRRERRARERQQQRQQRQERTAYHGPLHEEQYLPQLHRMFAEGALQPGKAYVVEVEHGEDDDGRMSEIVVREAPHDPNHAPNHAPNHGPNHAPKRTP